mgnify:CR=1 FL=1
MSYMGLSTTPICRMQPVTPNALGGGVYTLSNPDGTVVSCQPSGVLQTRPAGTQGPWERCTLSDNQIATYTIRSQDGGYEAIWSFALVPSVPDA